jgi:hypothetical protein
MKRYILLLLPMALMLEGCPDRSTGLAPAVQIPPIPSELSKKATPLPANTDASMGGQVTDNTNNIKAYNSIGVQLNKLIDLYNCVRQSVNNKETKCP